MLEPCTFPLNLEAQQQDCPLMDTPARADAHLNTPKQPHPTGDTTADVQRRRRARRKKAEERERLALAQMQRFRNAGVGAPSNNAVELAYKPAWYTTTQPPLRVAAVRLHDTQPKVLVRRETGGEIFNRWISAAHLDLIPEHLDFTTLPAETMILLDREYTAVFVGYDHAAQAVLVRLHGENGVFKVQPANLSAWVEPAPSADI